MLRSFTSINKLKQHVRAFYNVFAFFLCLFFFVPLKKTLWLLRVQGVESPRHRTGRGGGPGAESAVDSEGSPGGQRDPSDRVPVAVGRLRGRRRVRGGVSGGAEKGGGPGGVGEAGADDGDADVGDGT